MSDFKGFRHGVNLGGWLSQVDDATQEHFDTFITEADIQSIALMGLDHVRLPVDFNWIEDAQGAPIEAGLKHIDDCVRWCKAAGLHLLIDLHKAFGYSFDPLEKNADREIFFHDAALQDRFIALWKRLAERYGHCGFVAFELLNEVISHNVVREWNDIAARTIDAIREHAPEAWIVVGGVGYNHVRSVPLLDPPRDARIVYTCCSPTRRPTGWTTCPRTWPWNIRARSTRISKSPPSSISTSKARWRAATCRPSAPNSSRRCSPRRWNTPTRTARRCTAANTA